MSTCILYHSDKNGNIVDVDYLCSTTCMYERVLEILPSQFRRKAIPLVGGYKDAYSWGPHPCPAYPDYAVYCANCSAELHAEFESA